MSNRESGPNLEKKVEIMKSLEGSLNRIKELETALVKYMKLVEEALNKGVPESQIKLSTILEKKGIGAMDESNLTWEINEALERLEFATEDLEQKI